MFYRKSAITSTLPMLAIALASMPAQEVKEVAVGLNLAPAKSKAANVKAITAAIKSGKARFCVDTEIRTAETPESRYGNTVSHLRFRSDKVDKVFVPPYPVEPPPTPAKDSFSGSDKPQLDLA